VVNAQLIGDFSPARALPEAANMAATSIPKTIVRMVFPHLTYVPPIG
jgi:hypothetical protein